MHHLLDCVKHEGIELVEYLIGMSVRNTFANQYQTLGYSSLEEMFGGQPMRSPVLMYTKRAEVIASAGQRDQRVV